MKIFYLAYLSTLIFASPLVHTVCNAQHAVPNELERTIQLPNSKGCIYDLLQMITENTGYYLIYDSNLIDNQQKRKIKQGTRTIAQAIHEITGIKDLHLSVKENYILITPPAITQQPDSHIKGTLLDADTGHPIPYGTIHIKGLSYGTISNMDGQFNIHIPDTLQDSILIFSHIGYKQQEINIASLRCISPIVHLMPHIIPIQEVIVRMKEPKTLLNGMLNQRYRNYPSQAIYLTTFYREGTKFKGKLLDFTEGILHIYKPSIQAMQNKEQVKILQKKQLTFRSYQDSLIAKISGGIHTCLSLDVIAHLPTFLQPQISSNGYSHFFSDIVLLNDRLTYVIHFVPNEKNGSDFYEGDIYLDAETQALVQLQFNLHPDCIEQNSHILIKHQSKHVKLLPKEAKYTISYKKWGDTYYIKHVRGDLHFKVKRKKNWFSTSSTLHTWFEMATNHIDTTNVAPFPSKECIKTEAIFMDIFSEKDTKFWEQYNIIPKEQDLEESIKRIKNKSLQQR